MRMQGYKETSIWHKGFMQWSRAEECFSMETTCFDNRLVRILSIITLSLDFYILSKALLLINDGDDHDDNDESTSISGCHSH